MTQPTPGFLARLFGSRATPPAAAADDGIDSFLAFACTTCGRTDLPETGDWDPPICQECDAAINFDALEEADSFDV